MSAEPKPQLDRPAPSRAVQALRTARRHVRRYVRQAPGTYIWLAILLVTTIVIRHVSPELSHRILEKRSTNLHYLAKSPIRVLVQSALWIAGSGWFLYAVLYSIFHAQVEHWLGTRRWLAVVVSAHVGATFLSQGVLLWAIRHGHAPQSAVNTLDYGVSYALAGVVGVMTYRLPAPWRHVYAAAVLGFYGLGVWQSRDFTSVGHLSAVLIGLACHPLTRTPSGMPRAAPALPLGGRSQDRRDQHNQGRETHR